MSFSQPRPVRHAEKRRTSSCAFADRIAQVSVEHYHKVVPLSFRKDQKQTCVATIVAHNCVTKELRVLAMGVGTKFLSNSTLSEETASKTNYGDRVRDCHAEVLARRSFRRFLSLQMLCDLKGKTPPVGEDAFSMILEKAFPPEHADTQTNPVLYRLQPNITLHCYSSSAPCGNAVLKRFAACRKEVFQNDLGPDEWPISAHEIIPGHAISQGEFALLLKEDKGYVVSSEDILALEKRKSLLLNPKQRAWPSNCQTDWCPAGTTTVFSGKGSLHTCSDKILRWNLLGWQGSLLSSLLVDGDGTEGGRILPETFTVGRKLSAITCRRAVCCRAVGTNALRSRKRNRSKEDKSEVQHGPNGSNTCCQLIKSLQKHPVIMGTSVYLGDGVIETDALKPGQDVRFHSSLSFAWWLGNEEALFPNSASLLIDGGSLVCIDGTTGWALQPTVIENGELNWGDEVVHFKGKIVTENLDFSKTDSNQIVSLLSTTALTDLFLSIRLSCSTTISVDEQNEANYVDLSKRTLAKVREIKLISGKKYEQRKAAYLAEHEVLRMWNRRYYFESTAIHT